MKLNKTFSTLLFLLVSITIYAQSPYELSKKKDLPLALGGLVLYTGGLILNTTITPLTLSEINALDATIINAFDRSATTRWSLSANKASDYLQNTSNFLPLSLLAFKPIRKDSRKIGLLLVESFLIAKGLTKITKGTVQRIRPFAYNETVDLEEKMKKTAKRSFFSGHTSGAAVYSFFTAKVFSDYFPDSSWKPVIWTGAAIIPALTGYYRYRAGMHYSTDIITGYTIGALVGVLVPHLHRKKAIDNGLTFNVSPNGAYLGFKF